MKPLFGFRGKVKLERKLFTEHLICTDSSPRCVFSLDPNEVHLTDVDADAKVVKQVHRTTVLITSRAEF